MYRFRLDKNELFDTLENLASIPEIYPNILKFGTLELPPLFTPLIRMVNFLGSQEGLFKRTSDIKALNEIYALLHKPATFYFDDFTKWHPSLYVFAYDGISGETCLEHVHSFYKDHPDISLNRCPTQIIVNCKYNITPHVEHKHQNKSPSETSFHLGHLTENYVGLPYAGILTNLANYASYLGSMDILHHKYFDDIFND